MSQDIKAQLVTGKGLGAVRMEHKANSSATASPEHQEHTGHRRYMRRHMP